MKTGEAPSHTSSGMRHEEPCAVSPDMNGWVDGWMGGRRSRVAEDVTFRFERGFQAASPLSPLHLSQGSEGGEGARLADRLGSCEDPGSFIAGLSAGERSSLQQHSMQEQVHTGREEGWEGERRGRRERRGVGGRVGS